MSASTRASSLLVLLGVGLCISTACTTFSSISDVGQGGAGQTGSGNGGANAATASAAGPGATTGSGTQTSSTTGAGTTVSSSAASGPSTTSSGPGSTTAASSSAAASSSSSGGPVNDPAQICVDTINMYRATLGLAPYARWTAQEACAGQQAEKDYMAMMAHSAFQMCGEWAQNECPGWPAPASSMITQCLAQMWAEGPGPFNQGHGHYINMSSTQYTMVACGFYTTPQGDIWAVQDFQ